MNEDVLPAENGDFPNVMLVFQGRKYIFFNLIFGHMWLHMLVSTTSRYCVFGVLWERQIHTQTYQYYGH